MTQFKTPVLPPRSTPSQSLSNLYSFSGASRNPASPIPCHIVVGISDAQTCLNLTGRLRALREGGFRVTLISSPGKMLDEMAAREQVEAIGLPIRRDIAPIADLVSLLRLWRLLRRLKPEMTEFSTPKAGLLGNLASRFARVPVRVYMLRGLKLETAKGIKRLLLLASERVASACAQVVLCNSPSMRSMALALHLAPAAKLHLIGDGSTNGVDIDRFSPGESDVRTRLGIPDSSPVIGFVGRLTRDKGVPELIAAFDAILRKLPKARLLLVGWFDGADDALDADCQNRIVKHPRIHCTGFVAETAPYYRAMDLMVLPTWREGFPNAVLEASATGIPVITTVCTGSRDSVVPEVTGLLIPPGYPEAITEAVVKLLHDPARRTKMGRAARSWVCRHYEDERVLELAVSFYWSLLRPGGRPVPIPAIPPIAPVPAFDESAIPAWLLMKKTGAMREEAKPRHGIKAV